MQPDRLRARIQLWAEEEIRLGALPRRSGAILEAALYRGELPRGEAGVNRGRERTHRAAHRLGPHPSRGTAIGKFPRAAGPRLPGRPRRALDAGIVPDKTD